MPDHNYKAMCAELLAAIQLYTKLNPAAYEMSASELTGKLMDAMAATTAALSQPEPVAPTDEELEDLAEVMNVSGNPVPAMRRALELWGTPAIQPVPVAEPFAYLHRQGDYCEVLEIPLSEDEKARGWTETPLYSRHDLPIPNPTNQEDYE